VETNQGSSKNDTLLTSSIVVQAVGTPSTSCSKTIVAWFWIFCEESPGWKTERISNLDTKITHISKKKEFFKRGEKKTVVRVRVSHTGVMCICSRIRVVYCIVVYAEVLSDVRIEPMIMVG